MVKRPMCQIKNPDGTPCTNEDRWEVLLFGGRLVAKTCNRDKAFFMKQKGRRLVPKEGISFRKIANEEERRFMVKSYARLDQGQMVRASNAMAAQGEVAMVRVHGVVNPQYAIPGVDKKRYEELTGEKLPKKVKARV